jgi:hypothetical protein
MKVYGSVVLPFVLYMQWHDLCLSRVLENTGDVKLPPDFAAPVLWQAHQSDISLQTPAWHKLMSNSGFERHEFQSDVEPLICQKLVRSMYLHIKLKGSSWKMH